jgi:iron complex outermembrane receptor protein
MISPRISPTSSLRLSATAGLLALAVTLTAQTPPVSSSAAPAAGSVNILDDYIVETSRTTLDRKAPAVTQQVLAEDLRALNLTTTVNALRNLPNIFIRERFIGDKNAPVGIRGTSNRQTGRTLVLADGMLLSNFLGTGFGNSPRWFLVAPEELQKVAVIYGPFSALHAGNSLGGTVLMTTRMPEGFTSAAKGQFFTHRFRDYGTSDELQGRTAFLSVGDRRGAFSYYAFYNHLHNDSAPTTFATLNYSVSAAPGTGGRAVTGGFSDDDFANQRRFIYGAESPTEAIHDLFKLKLGYELSPHTHLRYTVAAWFNEENRSAPDTYLRDAAGAPVWSGRVEFGGRTFTLPATAFSLARRKQADLVNAFTFAHEPGTGWQFVASGNLYDVFRDKQRASTVDLPAARAGGAGQATIIGRTGWQALDVKLAYRADSGALLAHAPAFGWHFDRYFTKQAQYSLASWADQNSRTALTNGNGGATRTHALFAQDVWAFAPGWTLTPGLRWEKWRAADGTRSRDFTAAGTTTRVTTLYPERAQSALSPKVALAWKPAPAWNARLSLAEAYRFPTVGELFQGSISANGSVTNNDPNLRPERALDKDLTLERTLAGGLVRLSFFEEDVRRALINQSVLRPDGTSFSGTQNIGRIRARGAEVAFNQKRLFADSLDATVAVSYTDAKILSNPQLPASAGKQVPRIPYWQTRASLTWRPVAPIAWSAQIRTSSHQFNTLDNTDPNGGYGGVDDYLVVDTKLTVNVRRGLTASLGVDNVGDFRYYVFHPMQERTFFGEVNWSF